MRRVCVVGLVSVLLAAGPAPVLGAGRSRTQPATLDSVIGQIVSKLRDVIAELEQTQNQIDALDLRVRALEAERPGDRESPPLPAVETSLAPTAAMGRPVSPGRLSEFPDESPRELPAEAPSVPPLVPSNQSAPDPVPAPLPVLPPADRGTGGAGGAGKENDTIAVGPASPASSATVHRYRAHLPKLPAGSDVVAKEFRVTIDGRPGMLDGAAQQLAPEARSAEFDAPEGTECVLTLVYIDDAGNRSLPRSQTFAALDTTPPDAPAEFGAIVTLNGDSRD